MSPTFPRSAIGVRPIAVVLDDKATARATAVAAAHKNKLGTRPIATIGPRCPVGDTPVGANSVQWLEQARQIQTHWFRASTGRRGLRVVVRHADCRLSDFPIYRTRARRAASDGSKC